MDPELKKKFIMAIKAYWNGKDQDMKTSKDRRYNKKFFDDFEAERGYTSDTPKEEQEQK